MTSSILFSLLLAPTFAAPNAHRAELITYTTKGQSIRQVLKELSKQANMSLEATTAISDEPIILKLTDAPLRDVLARISEVMGAEWQMQGKVYRLVRPSDLVRKQDLDDRKQTGEALSKAIQGLVSENDKPFTDEDARKMAESMRPPANGSVNTRTIRGFRNQPVAASIFKMLAAIKPEELVLEEGKRKVFATNPTQMQKLLPSNAVKFVSEYVRVQKMIADANAKYTSNDGTRSFVIGGLTPQLGKGNANSIGKVYLAVTRNQINGISAELIVTDTSGLLVARGSATVSIPSVPSFVPDAQEKTKPLSPLASEFANLEGMNVSSVARSVMVMTTSTGGSAMPVTASIDLSSLSRPKRKIASQELLNLMSHPETYDPIGYVAGESMIESTGDAQLVATIPDSQLLVLTRSLAKGIPTETLFKKLTKLSKLSVSEVNGWTIVKPSSFTEVRRSHINRIALGQVARSIVNTSTLSLVDIGTYAANQVKPLRQFDLDGVFLSNLDQNVGPDDVGSYAQTNWNTLRVYGMMSSMQRSRLGSGGSVNFNDLLPLQREAIADDYYGSSDGGIFPGAMGLREVRGGFGVASQDGGIKEPTDIMPNGLPNGMITLNANQTMAVRAKDSISGAVRFLNIASMALYNSFKKNPMQMNGDFQLPNYDQFQGAVEGEYTFKYSLAPQIDFSRTMKDHSLIPGSRPGPWEGLPDDVKKQYNDYAERLMPKNG